MKSPVELNSLLSKFFLKSLKNIHTRINFSFAAPLDYAYKIRSRLNLKDNLFLIVVHYGFDSAQY